MSEGERQSTPALTERQGNAMLFYRRRWESKDLSASRRSSILAFPRQPAKAEPLTRWLRSRFTVGNDLRLRKSFARRSSLFTENLEHRRQFHAFHGLNYFIPRKITMRQTPLRPCFGIRRTFSAELCALTVPFSAGSVPHRMGRSTPNAPGHVLP